MQLLWYIELGPESHPHPIFGRGGGYFVMRISVILITSANLSQNEDFFPLSWNFSQCVKLRKQVNE